MTPQGVKELVQLALNEDLGRGDLTAQGVPVERLATAKLVAKEDCVASGLGLAELVLEEARARASVELHAADGRLVSRGATILTLSGNARDLLGIERTLLNFLQRTCGVATLAAQYRAALGDLPVKITDTRKTLPGFRYLDKRAVQDGGLHNHRFGLDGGVLVKENHIRAAGGITAIVKKLKQTVPHTLQIEVEVTNRAEAFEALEAGAEGLLLDNFSPAELATLVKELRKHTKAFLEASGGITLANCKDYAATGVDILSIGALTHSVRAVDLSLQFDFHA